MQSLPPYLLLAFALLMGVHRGVTRLPRKSRCVLLLLPLLFTGGAMLRDTAYAPADIGWNDIGAWSAPVNAPLA